LNIEGNVRKYKKDYIGEHICDDIFRQCDEMRYDIDNVVVVGFAC